MDDILSLQVSVIATLLGRELYKPQAQLIRDIASGFKLPDAALQMLRHRRDQLISCRSLLETVRQVALRIIEHPQCQNINFFSQQRLLLTSTSNPEELGLFENDELLQRAQLFLENKNSSRFRGIASFFVQNPDALTDAGLCLN